MPEFLRPDCNCCDQLRRLPPGWAAAKHDMTGRAACAALAGLSFEGLTERFLARF